MRRLQPAGQTVHHHPTPGPLSADSALERLLCWQGLQSARDERVEEALQQGHVVDGDLQTPRQVWRVQGSLGGGHVDPSAWELCAPETLRVCRA
jgi:hypothetical protein